MPEAIQPTEHLPGGPLLTLDEVSWEVGGNDVQDGAAILILLVDAAFPLRPMVH